MVERYGRWTAAETDPDSERCIYAVGPNVGGEWTNALLVSEHQYLGESVPPGPNNGGCACVLLIIVSDGQQQQAASEGLFLVPPWTGTWQSWEVHCDLPGNDKDVRGVIHCRVVWSPTLHCRPM